ncbi:MAG TPA: DUF2071 domain-containing protein [Solirubrobacterales bacterium]|nr:DUF2071 domain-containing protein [Solirubrobacterales bacterium]
MPVPRQLLDVGEAALRPAAVVSDSFRQRQVLVEADHRPWPLPEEPWLMGQVWRDLLFAHWRVPEAALRRVVPAQLPLDTRDGSAWLGVTPFVVQGLRMRGTAPVPVLSSFAEINVRTYVSVGGRPGIYFLSLDAASWPAVHAARHGYRLPYFHARIATRSGGAWVHYAAKRTSRDGPPAAFEARYRPQGKALPLEPGSLERWLTERYCLYTLNERGEVLRGEIHHPPWPLRPAAAEIGANTMARPFGIELEGEPLLHFSPRQDVALWPLRAVDRPGGPG